MTDSVLILAIYSAAIMAASLIGIWVQTTFGMTHTRMQMAMSFVAGLIIGVALFHLLPHGLERIAGPDAFETAVFWLAAGVLLMVLLLRVFPFHQHEVEVDRDHPGRGHRRRSDSESLSWVGVAVGLGLHTLTEGFALGASVRSGAHDRPALQMVSLGLFLAIMCHKPLDSFSVLGVMRVAGMRLRSAIALNALIALICPLGAFLAFWGFGLLGAGEEAAIGRAMAFGSGVLICVALSDLLPEIQFHRHDRLPLSVMLLLGILLAYGLHLVEMR